MLGSRRALLGSQVNPVTQWDATSGSLPSWLTFTRATNATIFDATGKLTYAPNNLLTSTDMTNVSYWSNTSGSLTTGVADPFGGNNAITLTALAANANLYQSPAGNASSTYISSVWIRRRTGTGNIYLYNPNNGATGITITSSWVRYFTVGVGGAATVASRFTVVTSGDAIDVYAPQLEIVTYQTTPSAYNPTTSTAYYGPRFDYDPVTLSPKGLLIEEARTNVALWSRDLTNAAWTSTNITAAKDQTGLDGVASSASSIVATLANGTCLQAITLVSSARFQTAYVKRITGSGVVNMTTDGGTTWKAITVTASWTRVSIPTQTLANPSVGFQIVTNGDKIAVDLVQNENGAFATSAIPTTTAAVARSADLPVGSVAGAGINTAQGTIAVRFQTPVLTQNGSARLLEGNGGSGFGLGINSAGTGVIAYDYIYSGGRNYTLAGVLTASASEQSISYGAALGAASNNGVSLTGTGGPGSGAGPSQFTLGSRSGSTLFYNGYIRGVAFYNRMLTQAQQNTKTGRLVL